MAAEGAEVAKKVISDEEVAALLEKNGKGDVRAYDLAGTQRIVRGRLPALETIHETFARNFRIALFSMLQREPHVTFEGIRTTKAGDYLAGITTPASLDICKIKPLPGSALIVFDPNLVFLMVDTYFGGPGRAVERTDDRGLTPTEIRFVHLVLSQAAHELVLAWAPVAAVEIELVKHESNPLFASVAAPTDTVFVNRFNIELPNGGGTLDLVMPSSMIEPLREVLTAGIVTRAGSTEAWGPALTAHLQDATIEIRGVLAELEVTIGDLTRMKAGDVLPIEHPEDVRIYIGDDPICTSRFGVSRGRNAVKIMHNISKSRA